MITALGICIIVAIMSGETHGHNRMHTHDDKIIDGTKRHTDQYMNISMTHDFIHTNDGLCIRKKNHSNTPDYNASPSVSGTCGYGCSACSGACRTRGYNWFCCDGSWCCCYGGQGPCQQAGFPCVHTYC